MFKLKINTVIKLVFLIYSVSLSIFFDNVYITIIFLSLNIIFYNKYISFYHLLKFLYQFKFLFLFIIIVNFNNFNNLLGMILIVVITLVASNLYIKSSNYKEIINCFYFLLKPLKNFKMDIDKLTLNMEMTILFIPIILKNGKQIKRNAESRGITFYKSTLEDKIKLIYILTIPLFIKTLYNCEIISNNLYLRFYDQKTFKYLKIQFNLIDYVTILSMLGGLFLCYVI